MADLWRDTVMIGRSAEGLGPSDVPQIPEWIVIVIAGAIGGFANALLTGGVSWVYRYTDSAGSRKTDLGTAGTVFIGAVAGFVFWALNGQNVNFTSTNILPSRVAGSLNSWCRRGEDTQGLRR